MAQGSLTASSRLSSRRWLVVATIVLAVLAQVAVSTLVNAFGTRTPEQLSVFFQALLVAVILTIPGLAFVAFIDRHERESPWLYAFALGWGMLGAAGLSLLLNTAALKSFMEVVASVDTGVASVTGFTDLTKLIVAVFFAPPIEELTKALVLVLLAFFLRGQFFTMRDGIVFGLLIGMGFNLLEAPFYLMNGFAATGEVPWGTQLVGRYVFLGLNGHALYTALFGAGVGYFVQKGGWAGFRGLVGGGLASILAHMLNNGLGGIALGLALLALGYPPPVGDSAGYPDSVPTVIYWIARAASIIVLQGWAYVLLFVLLRRSARYEHAVFAEQLAREPSTTITPEELAGVSAEPSFGLRRIAGLPATRSRDLVNAQNKVALHRSRAERDGQDPATDPMVRAWRSEIARLRLVDGAA